MLVFTRQVRVGRQKVRGGIVIDLREFSLGTITVQMLDVDKQTVRVGIEADKRIPVHRQEVFDDRDAKGGDCGTA
jgi:sRNA-binding carbon storage regulator CsrA